MLPSVGSPARHAPTAAKAAPHVRPAPANSLGRSARPTVRVSLVSGAASCLPDALCLVAKASSPGRPPPAAGPASKLKGEPGNGQLGSSAPVRHTATAHSFVVRLARHREVFQHHGAGTLAVQFCSTITVAAMLHRSLGRMQAGNAERDAAAGVGVGPGRAKAVVRPEQSPDASKACPHSQLPPPPPAAADVPAVATAASPALAAAPPAAPRGSRLCTDPRASADAIPARMIDSEAASSACSSNMHDGSPSHLGVSLRHPGAAPGHDGPASRWSRHHTPVNAAWVSPVLDPFPHIFKAQMFGEPGNILIDLRSFVTINLRWFVTMIVAES